MRPITSPPTPQPLPATPRDEGEAAFDEFVGQVFFSEMMKALRSTQQEIAYLGGGQGEQTMQSQFDQMLVDQLATSHGSAFSRGLR